jgi:hypothetical protein
MRAVESDDLLSPLHVISPVHEHIGILQQLHDAETGADRRALLYFQAQYGEFASWLHHDVGDFRMAQHWTDRALEWSQTASDPEMTAYILARKSQLGGDMRDSANGLDYGEAALELAPPRSRLKAAAAAYAAHAHALVDRPSRDSVLRMHDKARATLTDLDTSRESPWAVWMNDAYLDVERARRLSLLGEHNGADLRRGSWTSLPGNVPMRPGTLRATVTQLRELHIQHRPRCLNLYDGPSKPHLKVGRWTGRTVGAVTNMERGFSRSLICLTSFEHES